jgi:hypothetical protein
LAVRYTSNARKERDIFGLTNLEVLGVITAHQSMDIDSDSGLVAVVGLAHSRTYTIIYRPVGEDLLIVMISRGGPQ